VVLESPIETLQEEAALRDASLLGRLSDATDVIRGEALENPTARTLGVWSRLGPQTLCAPP